MMSILKKKPRHEVISIRLSEDRLKLLGALPEGSQ